MMQHYFPREIEDNHHNGYHLHIFCDVSMKAYAAIVYICESDNTSIVIAKT